MKARLLKFAVKALVAGVVLFLLGIAVLVVGGLNDRLGKADVALVLGNKVELDGKPSARLRARLDRALELYREGYFPEVITSGGVGKEGFDEARVMKDYLVAGGIPEDRVIMDSDGLTTFKSAENTVAIAKQRNFRSVLVVSQYFHVPRSRMTLEKFGISEVYSAHARFFELRDFYSTPRELFGYLSYRFRRYEGRPQPMSPAKP